MHKSQRLFLYENCSTCFGFHYHPCSCRAVLRQKLFDLCIFVGIYILEYYYDARTHEHWMWLIYWQVEFRYVSGLCGVLEKALIRASVCFVSVKHQRDGSSPLEITLRQSCALSTSHIDLKTSESVMNWPLSKWSSHTHTHISDLFVVLNQRITVSFYDNFFSESSTQTLVFTFLWVLFFPLVPELWSSQVRLPLCIFKCLERHKEIKEVVLFCWQKVLMRTKVFYSGTRNRINLTFWHRSFTLNFSTPCM
jgi:hypothetical protein